MAQLKEVLIRELQDLLHAETQLTNALPKMAEAAHDPKLKEAFQKHVKQTEGHVERLRKAFETLGEKAEPKTCKGMAGLIQEGEETIKEGSGLEPLAADLTLIAAAQKVEHYEIAAYGNVHCIARQIRELECARLLSQTLGEEESTDYLLTSISAPILQQASLEDMGAHVNLDAPGKRTTAKTRASGSRAERDAA